jgi:hypothetical protein
MKDLPKIFNDNLALTHHQTKKKRLFQDAFCINMFSNY